jgi:hypothetical protein
VIERELAEADVVSLGGVELVVLGIEPGAVQN